MRTIADLADGVTVCVLDDASYVGVVHRKPGWLAIRVPSGDVGYVHTESLDLDVPAAPTDPVCLEPVNLSGPGVVPGASRETIHDPKAPPIDLPSLWPGRFIPLHPMRVVFGMDIGTLWFRDQAAAQEQIGTTGTFFDLSAGLLIYDLFMISGSAGLGSASDYGSFTEVVVPELGGDPMTAESGLHMAKYSLALGVRTPFWALGPVNTGWMAAALFANYGWGAASGGRGIADCSDCSSTSFVLPGGSFWRVGVDLAIPTQSPNAAWGFTASYQTYEAGSSLSQEFMIGMNCWLR
ncbi:MAG: hypothetical protein ABIY55_09610 [Kofleriaceae bacterium]